MSATEAERAVLLRAAKMRIGMEGYARIIGSLKGTPKSTAELAAEHNFSHLNVLRIMRHCLHAKVVHRESWFRPTPKSRMVPMWALGGDGDVCVPRHEERLRSPNRKARRGQSTLILLTTAIEILREVPMRRLELAQELRMHEETASRVIAALRAAKLVYIESWHKPQRGATSPEYRYGPGKKDAPRPARRSQAEYDAMRRAKRQQVAMLNALCERRAA